MLPFEIFVTHLEHVTVVNCHSICESNIDLFCHRIKLIYMIVFLEFLVKKMRSYAVKSLIEDALLFNIRISERACIQDTKKFMK